MRERGGRWRDGGGGKKEEVWEGERKEGVREGGGKEIGRRRKGENTPGENTDLLTMMMRRSDGEEISVHTVLTCFFIYSEY